MSRIECVAYRTLPKGTVRGGRGLVLLKFADRPFQTGRTPAASQDGFKSPDDVPGEDSVEIFHCLGVKGFLGRHFRDETIPVTESSLHCDNSFLH
jgi:hypothetical protein